MSSRPANKQEMAVFDRFKSVVRAGRDEMSLVIIAGECMGLLEKWRRNQIESGMMPADFLPEAFNEADVERIQKRVDDWNELERALKGLEDRDYGMQVIQNQGKLDIAVFQKPEQGAAGLAGHPVLVLMVVGAAIVTGGILAALAITRASKQDSIDYKNKFNSIAKQMSFAPAPARAAFDKFLKSQKYAPKKSLWDKLSQSAGNIGLILGAGALLLFAMQKKKTI